MKVVINAKYGGFNLSDAAVERCIELGMKLTERGDPTADFARLYHPTENQHYYMVAEYERRNIFRSNPLLIQAVEELGDKANGAFCKLKIIDIPFDTAEGWHIDEYGGWEEVAEDHRRWS